MLQDKLNQVATYWPPGVPDPFGGTSWGKPRLLKVRWQAHQKLIRNREGKEVVSEAIVYTTEELDLDGRICLGESTADDPTTLSGSRAIQAMASMVGLSGEIVGWKYWL